MRLRINLLVLAGFAVLCSQSSAQEVDVRLTTGLEHTDNITRRASNEISDTVIFAGFGLDVIRKAADLEMMVKSDITYYGYTDNTFNDEVLANLSGDARWWLAPNRLSWEIHDTFGQIGINPLGAITPANRENTNYFRTGPDFLFRVGANNFVLGARFVDDSYEETPIDNQRLSARLGISRPMSPGRTLTFNASTERTDFDNVAGNSDFDRQNASIGFVSLTSRSSLNVEFGGSQIHDRGKTFSTLLSDVRYERKNGDSSSAWVQWQSDHSDAGRAFSSFQGSDQRYSDVQNVIPVSQPFKMQTFQIGGMSAGDVNGGNATVYWTDEDYEGTNQFDRQLIGLRLAADRNMTRTLTGGFSANYSRSDYTSGLKFRDLSISLNLQASLNRKLMADFYYRRDHRSSDAVAVGEYTDNRLGASLVYEPEW